MLKLCDESLLLIGWLFGGSIFLLLEDCLRRLNAFIITSDLLVCLVHLCEEGIHVFVGVDFILHRVLIEVLWQRELGVDYSQSFLDCSKQVGVALVFDKSIVCALKLFLVLLFLDPLEVDLVEVEEWFAVARILSHASWSVEQIMLRVLFVVGIILNLLLRNIFRKVFEVLRVHIHHG